MGQYLADLEIMTIMMMTWFSFIIFKTLLSSRRYAKRIICIISHNPFKGLSGHSCVIQYVSSDPNDPKPNFPTKDIFSDLKEAIMHIAEDKIHCISSFFFNVFIFVKVKEQSCT